MGEPIDRTPLGHYGDMFITEDLKMSLEGEMWSALQECVDKGWYTPDQAATEFAIWHAQFE